MSGLDRAQEIYAALRGMNLPGEVWALFDELHTLRVLLKNMHDIAASEQYRRAYEKERKRAYRAELSQDCPGHVPDKRKEPKENNINNIYNPLEGVQGEPLSRTDEFEPLWKRYPCKKSKGKAEKAFRTARKIATLEEISAGVDRLIAEKRDPQFWPYFASWLNAKGWLDEPTKAVSSGRTFPSWAASKYDYEQKYGKAEALNRYVEDAKHAAEGAKP